MGEGRRVLIPGLVPDKGLPEGIGPLSLGQGLCTGGMIAQRPPLVLEALEGRVFARLIPRLKILTILTILKTPARREFST